MMQLAFKPAILCGEDKIPITAGAAVVAPVRNRRIVAEYGVQGHGCFVVVTKILRPRINFFLPRRVPGHFTAEWIRLALPAIGARSHSCLKVISLRLHAFD